MKSDFFFPRFLTIYLLLTFCVVLGGCPENEYHRAAAASADVADSLLKLQAINESAFDAKKLSSDEAAGMAIAIGDATRVNDEFGARLRTVKHLDSKNKAELVALAGEMVNSFDRLNQEHVLRIKNPDAQRQFAVAIASAQAAISILRSVFSQGQRNPPPLGATVALGDGSVLSLTPAPPPAADDDEEYEYEDAAVALWRARVPAEEWVSARRWPLCQPPGARAGAGMLSRCAGPAREGSKT